MATETKKLNLEVIKELRKSIKFNTELSRVLKKKDVNYYTPENVTKAENELIYKSISFLDAINWDAKRLDSLVETNKRLIKVL